MKLIPYSILCASAVTFAFGRADKLPMSDRETPTPPAALQGGARVQLMSDATTTPPAPRAVPKADSRQEIHVRRIDRGEMETVAFLGIETAPVSPTLVAQLSLADKAGLVVLHIVPNSPAAGSLQTHDILLRLDDQILIDQHQLSVLIRNRKEGDEVSLTYLRAGKQATARVKLGKHEVPKMAEVLRRGMPLGAIPGAPLDRMIAGKNADREHVDRVLELIQRSRANNGPMRARIERGGPGLRGTSVNTARSNLVYSDEKGSLELTLNGDEKILVAKSPSGEQQFSGPVGTPEQRKGLTPELRERLEKLESMQDVTFRTDGDFKGAETRVYRPGGEQIRLRRGMSVSDPKGRVL